MLFWGTAKNYGDWMRGGPGLNTCQGPCFLGVGQLGRVREVGYPEHPIPINFCGTLLFTGSGKIIEICACLNLEVLSVPEGLVHSIGILEAPGLFLARRWPKS